MSLTQVATRGATLRQLKLAVLHRPKSILHLERKLYHLSMGLFCFSLYAFVLTRGQALWTLGVIGGVWVGADLMRLHSPRVNELALRLFGKVMRREELVGLTGNTYYILGLFFLVLIFPRPIALLGVLYLALGDPAAATIGTLYGRHKVVGEKSWEGACANWIASAVGTAVVAMGIFQWSGDEALLLVVLGATASTVAELVPLPIDDNFSIPVISAALLTLFSAPFGLF